MPKILNDIQNKILSIAEQHFKDKGFEKTDMREIAAESNIAVGTVYLHFQNKEELYQKVIRNSWTKSLEKIRLISQKTDAPELLLKEIILLLVEEMTNRKSHESLWMEIGSFHHHDFAKEMPVDHFSGMRDPITAILSTLIQRMASQNGSSIDEGTCSQLGSFAFIMTVDLCMQELNHANQQIELIPNLIAAYIEK
jgi:AcrR family transcriptional regulator